MSISEKNAAALRQRGFDPDLLELYGIVDSSRRGFDIEIPYFDGDRLINHKYRNIAKRNTGDNFSQDTGATPTLWNAGAIGNSELADEPLLISEGEFDALSAIQAGYRRTVSVPNGAPPESGNLERYGYLDDAPMAAVGQIILCCDDDPPGANLLDDLSGLLGRSRCKFLVYPKGCKDLNDVLQRHGVGGVQDVIDAAEWMAVPGVYDVDELPPEPTAAPHDVGIPGLEGHYRARLGDLCVITGIPAHGKSTVAINIACHMAKAYGWPVAMASFEMRYRNDLVPSLKTWYTGCPIYKQTEPEAEAAHAWVKDKFAFIRPDENDDPDLGWILETMRTAVLRRGCKLVIIDPWNELEHRRDRGETLTEYVGAAIKRLKRFAVKHRVHLIVVAHPAKMMRNKNGQIPKPNLYDISDSAHFYNKPDVGIVVHREGDDSVIEVAKSRYHREIGKPGLVRLRFNWQSYSYISADEPTPEERRYG